MNSNIYPDFPRLAKHLNIGVVRFVKYEVWHNCFFIKIAGLGWRFVSKQFLRRFVKKPKVKKPKNNCFYRVIRTWDNGSSYFGDRIISVLIQSTNSDKSDKPEWDTVFLHQKIDKRSILRYSPQGVLIKTELDYGQAMGLY